jgi:hypothetical protein
LDDNDIEPEKPPSEKERRERILLRLIANSTSQQFWIGLKSGIASAYRETYESNQNDTKILQESHGFKTIFDRHFWCDKVLFDRCLEFGYPCIPEQVRINRWRYAQCSFGAFTSIQKYSHSEKDLPKASDFRKKLARSGGISIQDDMLRPQVARVGEKVVYNGILIHGPESRAFRKLEFRDLGFLCFAIPVLDYSEWGAVLSVDRIIAECENQGRGGDGTVHRRRTSAPRWRKKPDEKE